MRRLKMKSAFEKYRRSHSRRMRDMKKYVGPSPDEGPEDEAPNSQEAKREADLEIKKPVRKARKINVKKSYQE